jgi:hypothetical protein
MVGLEGTNLVSERDGVILHPWALPDVTQFWVLEMNFLDASINIVCIAAITPIKYSSSD